MQLLLNFLVETLIIGPYIQVPRNMEQYCISLKKKVDSGGIIAAVFFDIKPTFGPLELLQKADIEAEKLIISLIEKILKNEVIEVNKELTWEGDKRSRKDFIEICRIASDVSQRELKRRIKAFHVEGRKNLYTIIHGYKFYY